MREMKQSGIEWLGEIPKEWKVGRIKNIVSQYGSGTTPESGNELYYDEGSHFWIQSGDLYNTTYITDTQKKITDLALAKCKSLQKYISNFIVIAMYGASIGNVSISKIDAYVNQACYCLKTNKNNDLKFLYYGIDACKENLLANSFGGTQPNINSAIIRNQTIVIPQLSEQTAIADFLDDKCRKIDTLINNQEKTILELIDYKKSIIQKKLTDGNWGLRKMKWIGSIRNGLTYNPNDMCDSNEGKLVLRSSNIQQSKLCFDDNVYVKMDIPKDLLLEENDLLICSRNGSRTLIGKCALIDKITAGQTFGAFMCVFRSEYNKFVYYFLQSNFFSDYIGNFATSTVNQLTVGVFNNIEMPFPPITKQKEIIEFLDKKTLEVDDLISLKQQKIAELKEYKKSLIYDYVTGKKAVAG